MNKRTDKSSKYNVILVYVLIQLEIDHDVDFCSFFLLEVHST